MNSSPHIGHAFEFIIADALKRFLSNRKTVYLNVGLDEHGTKVYSKAKELNIPVSEHISGLTNIWLDFCKLFKIDYDNFYKTSDAKHHEKVKIIWNRFIDRGDIYKKEYTGKYCVGCESFKVDKDLLSNKCKDHPNLNIEDVSEENYFFKLSKYKNDILNAISLNDDFLLPSYKKLELINLINDSEDISVSRLRKSCPWGVSVPNDDNHTIYVWFEALLNYIFAAGYLTDDFNWDNVIQICGPDNLRFQGVIFQSFLRSEGIKYTDKLLVHGTIVDKDGVKMSKSIGNVIDPVDQVSKYGIDAVRYYSLAGISTYSNSKWDEKDLINLYNSDICNDWGNLISRTLHLIDIKKIDIIDPDDSFKKIVDDYVSKINLDWNFFKIKDALFKTNELVKIGNKYINDNKPWSLENGSDILSNLYYLILVVNELYRPVFADRCDEINSSIEERKKIITFKKII